MERILIVSSGFYPITSGASHVMTTFVEELSDWNFVVATSGKFPIFKIVRWDGNEIHYVFNRFYHISSRLENIFGIGQIPFLQRYIKRLLKIRNINVVMAVYPSLPLFKAAYYASRESGKKFIPYFHDLLPKRFKKFEQEIVNSSYIVTVINPAIKKYFKKHYSDKKITVLNFLISTRDMKFHFSTERKRINKKMKFVWSGNLHGGNINSLKRIFKSIVSSGHDICALISHNSQRKLIENVVNSGIYHIKDRRDYLEFLSKCDAGIVTLDWPEEANLESDELEVAFPTKVIDYIIAKKPILAHCPKHYYLSEFLTKNKIGIVISDKNDKSLKNGLNRICDEFDLLSKNTMQLVSYFSVKTVKEKFRLLLE